MAGTTPPPDRNTKKPSLDGVKQHGRAAKMIVAAHQFCAAAQNL